MITSRFVRSWLPSLLPVLAVTSCFANAALAQFISSSHFSRDIQWRSVQATVRLSGRSGPCGYMGSGAVIGRERDHFYVATAAHCIASDLTIQTFGAGYPHSSAQFGDVETLIEDPWSDFALLRVRGRYSGLTLTIGSHHRLPKRGDQVLSIGCGNGAAPTAEVNLLEGGNARHWIVRQSGTMGRSGGPLISADGFLIGCTSATDGEYTYYSHLGRMRELVANASLAKLYRSADDAAIARNTPSDRSSSTKSKSAAAFRHPPNVPGLPCPNCPGCAQCKNDPFLFDNELAIAGISRFRAARVERSGNWKMPGLEFDEKAIGDRQEFWPRGVDCQPSCGPSVTDGRRSSVSIKVSGKSHRIVIGGEVFELRDVEIFVNGLRIR